MDCAASGPPNAFKRFSGHLNFPPRLALPSPPTTHQLAFSTATQPATCWTTLIASQPPPAIYNQINIFGEKNKKQGGSPILNNSFVPEVGGRKYLLLEINRISDFKM